MATKQIYDPLTGMIIDVPEGDNIVGGGNAFNTAYTECTLEVDGGCAGSVYRPTQQVDGGNA